MESSEVFSDRTALERHQRQRLGALLAAVLAANSFYRTKLERAGIGTADDICAPADYARLPLTTKHELSEDQIAHPPFGTNLSAPLEHYHRLHQTSGTTGVPLRWLDTPESWRWWSDCWAAVYRGAGVTDADRIFFAFSFGPFIGFWSALAGAEALGALVIPGGGMSSEQRLHHLLDNRATVLVSTPTYALHLGEQARRSGVDLAAAGVRVTIHAGEPGAGIEATRARIEALWGARCFDHAGATEIGAWGFECEHRNGLHINEEHFIAEVLDPATGAPADEGELVLTNLGRAAMPVIRYRTGDHVRLDRAPCACGRSFVRCLGGVLGRIDDAIIVRGVNVFPSAIENIVRRHLEAGEFQIEVSRREEMDELVLRIECDRGRGEAIAAEIRRQLGLRIGLVIAAPDSLPRYELKSRRYIDRRHEQSRAA
ncbi:MAG TPA: hypothetical protein VEB21_20745 [Terriglobales bacterium]|nr:hypothetical protein [Terriglobales bacterium]